MKKSKPPRQNRKLDHLRLALALPDASISTGLDDIIPIHQALPELDMADVDTSCTFLGKMLKLPFCINAITGGHPDTAWINRELSLVAAKTGIAMAVGSQRAALTDKSVRETFMVARQVNPKGILLANLGASCSLEEARSAVEMIAADGLQLHLNVPQEVLMPEGDCCFKGMLENIAKVVASLSVPVMVKEVGFGLSRETVKALYDIGVRCMDVGGSGGTDFAAIEIARDQSDAKEKRFMLQGWGIPTAISLLEGLSLQLDIQFVASGGIRSSLDMVRSLMLGAKIVAMARPPLEILIQENPLQLEKNIETLRHELATMMLLLGAKNIASLPLKPLIIKGLTAEWMERRGIDIHSYAKR